MTFVIGQVSKRLNLAIRRWLKSIIQTRAATILMPSAPLNEAYQYLMEYCSNYRFSFTREEFMEQNPVERLREQFAYDPVWGGRDPDTDKKHL